MNAGELFAGYGGLALATELVFNAETAWVCRVWRCCGCWGMVLFRGRRCLRCLVCGAIL